MARSTSGCYRSQSSHQSTKPTKAKVGIDCVSMSPVMLDVGGWVQAACANTPVLLLACGTTGTRFRGEALLLHSLGSIPPTRLEVSHHSPSLSFVISIMWMVSASISKGPCEH